jgi:hypothetical protein
MTRLALLLAVLVAAGCGGSSSPSTISADHATLTQVHVRGNEVEFDFDGVPAEISTVVPTQALAECGSGAPVRVRGAAVVVVHFRPAQTQGLPKRIAGGSGPVLELAKVCDFEADVGWAIGLRTKRAASVSQDGSVVTVTFGG